jgi:hypothetical protein
MRHPWVPAALALPPERVEVFIRDDHKYTSYSTRQVVNGYWSYMGRHPLPAPMPHVADWRFPDDYEPRQALDTGDAGTATAAHDGRDDRGAGGNSFTP